MASALVPLQRSISNLAIVDGLAGAAPAENNKLTLAALIKYVRESVPAAVARGREISHMSGRIFPRASTDSGGIEDYEGIDILLRLQTVHKSLAQVVGSGAAVRQWVIATGVQETAQPDEHGLSKASGEESSR